jgi:predicted N-acetyltransferase YhbS
VARLEIVPFDDGWLDAAAVLLAARHRAQRAAEPALAARYEDALVARDEIEAVWRRDGATGAVALDGRRPVGYTIGAPREESWGPNVWVEVAGHAVERPETARDLYAALAEQWVEQGRTCHYALLPAEPYLIEAWFRSGFGQQHAHALREPPVDDGPASEISIRPADERDLDVLVELDAELIVHQRRAPVFARGVGVPDPAEVRQEFVEELAARPQQEIFVAELDGRVVSTLAMVPIERSGSHAGLARPDDACLLAFAASLPEARGSGAGLALTREGLRWSREQGYATVVVDWRVTNLLSSRFWPRRGFRTTFLRLHRAIDVR